MNIGDLVVLNRSTWSKATSYSNDLGIVLEIRDHIKEKEVLIIYPIGGEKSWILSSNISEVASEQGKSS